jgi:hypothetical protein
MQMRSRKLSNSPGLGRYSLLHHDRSTAFMEWSTFLFLSWLLDDLGWSVWPDSFFYSLVSRVTYSARAYLLVIANIYSDVLGFFIVSFVDQGRIPESLLGEHNNRFIVNLRNEVSLVVKALDELSE